MAKSPARLDEPGPGDLVNFAGDRQSLGALERFDERHGLVAEYLERFRHGDVTKIVKSLVQVAHTLARGAATEGGERQES